MKKIFSLDDIIVIVNRFLEDFQMEDTYGYVMDEEGFPFQIENKLSKLGAFEDDFMEKVEEIAEEVYALKTGELNELNRIHEEVCRLSKERLGEYLNEGILQ